MDNICTFSTILAKEHNAKSYKNQCTVCLNKQTTQRTSRWPQAISSMPAEPIQLVMLLQCVELDCVGRVCVYACRWTDEHQVLYSDKAGCSRAMYETYSFTI